MTAANVGTWPPVITMTLLARLDAADDELTCFVCRGPRCEYGWTVQVDGARLTHGRASGVRPETGGEAMTAAYLDGPVCGSEGLAKRKPIKFTAPRRSSSPRPGPSVACAGSCDRR